MATYKNASLAIVLQFFVFQLCHSQELPTVKIEYGINETCNITTNFDSSSFVDCNKKTSLMIHGWNGSEENVRFREIVKILSEEPYNYNSFFVNWEKIAGNIFYPAVDTDFVGKCLVKFLLKNVYEKCKNHHVHLIGHSLGSHVAGNCGRALKKQGYKLDVITGLDPAGPLYYRRRRDKLSKKDAKFVVVLHTDAYGLGTAQNLGHVNFNANGGDNQPGCPLTDLVGCQDHRKSYFYFLESIMTNQTEKFIGTNCMVVFGVETMRGRRKLVFGLDVDENARGVYCFDTNKDPPYAMGDRQNKQSFGDKLVSLGVGFVRCTTKTLGLGRRHH